MVCSNFNRICVVGLGYIGLPTAAMFASRGKQVIGVDINTRTVDVINRGQIHIVEPDLDMVVHAAVHEGYLRASTTPEPADAFLIAVPTPFKGEDHTPDLSYVEAAARSIAPVLARGNLVILESTSPVGTTEAMAEWLSAARPDLSFPQTHGAASDIRVAHCPERVLPGKVMQELIANDRVIGGMTTRCAESAAELYRTFVVGECVIASNPRVAEMAKLTENSFRDVNIAFANELSMLCHDLDINVWELIRVANRHPRVNILKPGPGVGGHCIAVDPWFLIHAAPNLARTIRAAREVNDDKSVWVLSRIKSVIQKIVCELTPERKCNITVACFGLSFKADIDDLRESPALKIALDVDSLNLGNLLVVEPHITNLPPGFTKKARLVSADEAASSADLVVLLVGHKAFKPIFAKWPNKARLLDFCGLNE